MISTGVVALIIALIAATMFGDYMNNQRVYFKHKFEDLERENLILKTMISKLPRMDFRGDMVDETFDKDDDEDD